MLPASAGSIPERRLHIEIGETANARQTIPLRSRRRDARNARPATGDWIVPAQALNGRIELSNLKKQHAKAYKLAEFEHVPIYIPAYVPDAVGGPRGPAFSPVLRGAHFICNDQDGISTRT